MSVPIRERGFSEEKVDSLCPGLCLFLPLPGCPRTITSLSYCIPVGEKNSTAHGKIRQYRVKLAIKALAFPPRTSR